VGGFAAEVKFKTKLELALDMIRRAKQDEIPGNIILADGAYGDSTEFRNTVRQLGFDFAVGVLPTLGVVRLDRAGRINTKPQSAAEVVASLPQSAFRKVTWRKWHVGLRSSSWPAVAVASRMGVAAATA
jgi:SRSO17 transposase